MPTPEALDSDRAPASSGEGASAGQGSSQGQGTSTEPTAGEPPPEPPASEPAPAGEIVVYGQHRVEQARAEVARRLEQQGYDREIHKDGYTIFRHEDTWKGDVQVHDDGWIRIKRQPVQFRPPEGSPVGWATCIVVPLCVRSSGQTVSTRKLNAVKRRALSDVDPLARVWGERVADLHVDHTLQDLPDRLTALWEDGVALEHGKPDQATPEGRKQALLDFWQRRTETVWGRRVRAAVETFIRAEVQYSPFAFTPEEIAAFNARTTSQDPLDLGRDWELVMADLEKRSD